MAYFNWGDDLCVGSLQIDEDHKKLVGFVNDLHTATSRGEGREVVGEILSGLITYTQEHFQREEQHMERLRYPKLDVHRRHHAALIQTVLELRDKYEQGHVTVPAQVSALLRDWLSIHIRREDKAFVAATTNNKKH